MGRTLAALVLGAFLVIAAVVLVNPDYSDDAWELSTGLLWWLGVCVVIVILLVILLFILAVWAEARW